MPHSPADVQFVASTAGADECLRTAITARAHLPAAPMLVLSQYVEVSYAGDLLADGSGAVGYLLKDRVARVEEFLDALYRVAGGATVLDTQVVAESLAKNTSATSSPSSVCLPATLSTAGCSPSSPTSEPDGSGEQGAVCVDCGLSAQMGVQHGGVSRDLSAAY